MQQETVKPIKIKAIVPTLAVILLITWAVKVILDVTASFILFIPFDELVPVPIYALYLIPSSGLYAGFAMWLLDNRFHRERFKIGVNTAIISAIIIQALVVPWTYDLSGYDLPLLLTWGLSYVAFFAAAILGTVVYFKQI